MQLTKDDIINSVFRIWLDYSKFLQVRKFYEDYNSNHIKFMEDEPELYRLYEKSSIGDLKVWLFNYCFVEGLK